ncbi:hypothetical protein EV294_102685 [Paenibacillus sp. BK033]|nr:hypothetical protein EV294_102685 [Paenibacillus sp. BK033]
MKFKAQDKQRKAAGMLSHTALLNTINIILRGQQLTHMLSHLHFFTINTGLCLFHDTIN